MSGSSSGQTQGHVEMTPTPPPKSSPLLDLDGVARTYQGVVPVNALYPTTLRVNAGDYIGIMGPSGSGKSTMLNLLGLLDTPTQGTYRVVGVDVSTLSEVERTALRAHTFGFVFQSFHLLPNRSVTENVEIGMLYTTVNAHDRRDRAHAALTRVGLGHRLNVAAGTLSGGERQRVAIARAIASRPRVLLCDEPTGNLDSVSSNRLMDLLDRFNRDGLTIVVITHDPAVGNRTKRLVEIRDGRLTHHTA